jgi:hypothetical protein
VSDYTAGLDLAKASDYSALVIASRHGGMMRRRRYEVIYAKRWRGTSYPALVEQIGAILGHKPFGGNVRLQLDATGVGQAVLDLLEQARSDGYLAVTQLTPIVFSAGLEPNPMKNTVPKRDLTSRLEVLFSEKRLQFAHDLPLGLQIRDELKHYAARITPSGRATFEASTGHDDLVTACALAVYEVAPTMAITLDFNPDDRDDPENAPDDIAYLMRNQGLNRDEAERHYAKLHGHEYVEPPTDWRDEMGMPDWP